MKFKDFIRLVFVGVCLGAVLIAGILAYRRYEREHSILPKHNCPTVCLHPTPSHSHKPTSKPTH